MRTIDHAAPKCTGNWRLVEAGGVQVIRCEYCSARHPASTENRLAAIDENYAGRDLRRLAAEGQALLEAQRRDGAA